MKVLFILLLSYAAAEEGFNPILPTREVTKYCASYGLVAPSSSNPVPDNLLYIPLLSSVVIRGTVRKGDNNYLEVVVPGFGKAPAENIETRVSEPETKKFENLPARETSSEEPYENLNGDNEPSNIRNFTRTSEEEPNDIPVDSSLEAGLEHPPHTNKVYSQQYQQYPQKAGNPVIVNPGAYLPSWNSKYPVSRYPGNNGKFYFPEAGSYSPQWIRNTVVVKKNTPVWAVQYKRPYYGDENKAFVPVVQKLEVPDVNQDSYPSQVAADNPEARVPIEAQNLEPSNKKLLLGRQIFSSGNEADFPESSDEADIINNYRRDNFVAAQIGPQRVRYISSSNSKNSKGPTKKWLFHLHY